MRVVPLIMVLTGLVWCSSVQKRVITYNDLDGYMKSQPILSTPRDDLLFVNLTCFEDFDGNNKYKEKQTFSYQGFLGEGIYSEHYYLWDKPRTLRENVDSSDYESLSDQDIEGVVFEYSMEEDDAGEYIASLNLSKRTFLRKKEFNKEEPVNVFKHIEYNKEYYPKNKQPIKVYDDKEEVCYVTASW